MLLGQANGLDRLHGNLLDRAALDIEHFEVVPLVELFGLLQLAGAIGQAGIG